MSNETDRLDGFLGEGTLKLCGFELRPFTFGSLAICRKLGLTLFTKENAKLSEEETIRQLSAFFWVQSSPVKEMLSAVRSDTAWEAIEEFEFSVPLHALPALLRRISEISRLAAAAAVEVVERPGSDDKDAPGN